jgi:uncharacterized membrane protein
MHGRFTSSDSDRSIVIVAYILHLIGAIVGVTSLIGLAINYFHDSRKDWLVENHHRWMIRSFWWALVWMVVGWVTTVLLIGWLILGAVWLWYLYRHIRGLIAALSDQPLPR